MSFPAENKTTSNIIIRIVKKKHKLTELFSSWPVILAKAEIHLHRLQKRHLLLVY